MWIGTELLRQWIEGEVATQGGEREKKILSLCFMKQWAGVKFFKGKIVFLSSGEVSNI